jgi:hypothetical protein
MKTNKNSKTNKSIIDVYPTIYGVDLVVANRYTTIEQINKSYCTVDHEDLIDTDAAGYTAYTEAFLCDKKTNKPCILVRYMQHPKYAKDKKLELINTAAHEALHACMDIYSKIGEDVYKNDSNELFAYLIGWITECIYKTWTKK